MAVRFTLDRLIAAMSIGVIGAVRVRAAAILMRAAFRTVTTLLPLESRVSTRASARSVSSDRADWRLSELDRSRIG